MNLAIKQTFPNADQVIRANTAVAVAVDANLTPSAILMQWNGRYVSPEFHTRMTPS